MISRFFSSSEWMAAEKIEELNDEDNDNGEFEKEGTALVELVDHEAVEVFGGVDFLVDEVFVVGDTDFGCSQFIEARREHVTEEFNGVIGVLGQLGNFEQDGVEFCG